MRAHHAPTVPLPPALATAPFSGCHELPPQQSARPSRLKLHPERSAAPTAPRRGERTTVATHLRQRAAHDRARTWPTARAARRLEHHRRGPPSSGTASVPPLPDGSHWQAQHAGGVWERGRGARRAAVTRARPGLRPEAPEQRRPSSAALHQRRLPPAAVEEPESSAACRGHGWSRANERKV
jgi:hypothetical protein